MFEENEVLTFILGLISVAVALPFSRRANDPGIRLFCVAILLLTFSYLFTNLEAVIFPDTFNILEHFCFSLSALCFFLAVPRLGQKEMG